MRNLVPGQNSFTNGSIEKDVSTNNNGKSQSSMPTDLVGNQRNNVRAPNNLANKRPH